jgi:hypothetical protein
MQHTLRRVTTWTTPLGVSARRRASWAAQYDAKEGQPRGLPARDGHTGPRFFALRERTLQNIEAPAHDAARRASAAAQRRGELPRDNCLKLTPKSASAKPWQQSRR